MPELRLPYGDSTVQVELPDRAKIVGGGNGGPRQAAVADQGAAVRDALTRPIGLPRIGELVRPGARVLIAFDDPTAPSFGPVRRLAIEAVLEELGQAGVPEENVRLLCANALHRRWTREELARILSEELVDRFADRLQCHDAEDSANIVDLGKTPSGYDVDLHRLAVESDLTVYVNAACHLGFNGGGEGGPVGVLNRACVPRPPTPDGKCMSLRDKRKHEGL